MTLLNQYYHEAHANSNSAEWKNLVWMNDDDGIDGMDGLVTAENEANLMRIMAAVINVQPAQDKSVTTITWVPTSLKSQMDIECLLA